MCYNIKKERELAYIGVPMRISFLFASLLIVFLSGCSGEDPEPVADYDLKLTGITVSTGTLVPPFDPDIKDYSMTVASTTESIDITGSSPDGTMSYTPPMPAAITNGTNRITIRSVSPDRKETNTIQIVVYRPSSDAFLSGLSIDSGTLSPSFSPDTTRYYSYLPANTVSVIVDATAAENGTIVYTPSQPSTLSEGSNRIVVQVTAEGGSTTKKYCIDLYRLGEEYASSSIGKMLYVPGGSFQRDDDSGNISTVSPFRISTTEITRQQYSSVTGLADPSDTGYSTGTTDPVQRVNWYGTLVFCNRLSILEGLQPVYTIDGSTNPDEWGDIPDNNNSTWNTAAADWNATGYRLPTEMEWMWAAMGANTDDDPWAVNTTGYTKNYAGETITKMVTLSMEDFCWYTANSGTKTHPAGTKMPNELGILDMSGNVWEWCWDRNASYPSGTLQDYSGAASGTLRIVRGGDWSAPSNLCSLSSRDSVNPHFRVETVGFRVVRK